MAVKELRESMRVQLATLIAALLAALPASGAAQPTTAGTPDTSSPKVSSAPPEAYYQFILGRRLESDGDIDRAIAAHREAARLDPSSAEVRAELAGLYARQGRVADAITEARRALAIDGTSYEAHRVLGMLLASVVEETAPRQQLAEQLRQAIGHLEQVRRPEGVSPDPAVGLTLGRLYLRTGEPQKAVTLLRGLVEHHPILEVWLLLGQAHSAAGQPEEATRALEEGTAFDPRLFTALAEIYERQDQWTKAAETYERAAGVGVASADVRSRWASALLNTGGEDQARRARQLLRGILDEEPSDDHALYLLAQAERRLRAYDAAEEAARRLIALQPGSPLGPYALAQVFQDRREYAQVVDTLQPALAKATPEAGWPARQTMALLTQLGFAQLQLGRNDDAVATFERARTLAEGDSAQDVYLAQALVAAKRFDEALRVLAPVRERQADDFRIAQVYVRALSGAGRTDEAVAVLESAVAASPSEPSAYLALADLLAEKERHGEAHKVLDDAAKRFPKDPLVVFQRGALYERAGEVVRAEAEFREVLSRDPDHAPTLNYLGYMLAERGVRLQEALRLIERALAIDPGNGAYLDSLGWAYFQLKQYDRARDHLARAAEQLPSNSVVQDHFGDALAALGRSEEAIAAWTRALEGDRESVEIEVIEGKIRRARSRQAER